MKEYSFEEVIANIKVGETYKCTDCLYGLQTITKDNVGFKFNKDSEAHFSGTNNIQRFVKVEKPVSFIEAVSNPNNKVRVLLEKDNFFNSDVERFNQYMDIKELFKELSKQFSEVGISKAICSGKWYIEN